jgi:AGZA family xanthine/uracil permease-like MFS transporter
MDYHVLWVAPPGPDRGIDVIAHGFIITAMIWGAAVADLIDKRPARAALWCALGGILSLFGLMHSVVDSGALYLPWLVTSREPAVLTIAYGCLALLFFALSPFSRREGGAAPLR